MYVCNHEYSGGPLYTRWSSMWFVIDETWCFNWNMLCIYAALFHFFWLLKTLYSTSKYARFHTHSYTGGSWRRPYSLFIDWKRIN